MNEQTNKKFRNIPELCQSALELNCYAFSFLKLFSHNCAEYSPTDITVSQQTVLSHNLSVFQFTQAEWQSVLLTKTKLMEKRCEHKERIRKKPTARLTGTKKLAVVSKRPAAVILKHGIRRKVTKRHTFNKRRVSQDSARICSTLHAHTYQFTSLHRTDKYTVEAESVSYVTQIREIVQIT